VGVYRIIYELRDENTVRVVAIRHRGQAYEADPR
jgi:mRNA interferase RelE/StbE